MTDPSTPVCYKCGALDHVATNRNCPRPRAKAAVPTTPSTPTFSSAISAVSLSPGSTGSAREASRRGSSGRPNHTIPKEARLGTDTKFWYYKSDGNDGTSTNDESDRHDSESDVGNGAETTIFDRTTPRRIPTRARPAQYDGDITSQDGPMPFEAPQTQVPRKVKTIRSMNELVRQLRKASGPAAHCNNSKEKIISPKNLRQQQQQKDSKRIRHKKSYLATYNMDSPVNRQYSRIQSSDKNLNDKSQADNGNAIPSRSRATTPSINTPPPTFTVGPGWLRRESDAQNQNNGAADDRIEDEGRPPSGQPPNNATWGELFEWYDRPENDEYSAQNLVGCKFDYMGNRNDVSRPYLVKYGRHLQGWRECRSVGKGLGYSYL